MTEEPQWNEGQDLAAGQVGPGPDLLGIVLRHKWLIALCGLLGFALGYLYYLQQPPVYESSARVLVVRKRPNVLPIQGPETPFYYEDYLGTHSQLIKSPVIVQQAVAKAQLSGLRSFAGMGDPTGTIIRNLTVKREGKTNILNLSYDAPTSQDCGAVLNAIIDSYATFLGKTYQDISDETVQLITKAKDELRREIEAKDKEYLEFRSQAPLVWNGTESENIHQQRLSNIESARFQERMNRMRTEATLRALEAALQQQDPRQVLIALAPKASFGQQGVAQDRLGLESQVYPMLLEEQMLLQDYGPDHPRVKSLHKRIEFARDFFLKRGAWFEQGGLLAESDGQANGVPGPLDTYLARLRQQLEDSKMLEQTYSDLFERERQEARSIADFVVRDELYRKERDRLQQLYDSVVQRLQEVDLIKDYGGYKTQVISPAGPGSQIAPVASRILTVAVMLGLMAGFGLAYLQELLDKSFRSPDDIRRRLGLPVMGHIPIMVPTEQEVADAESDESGLDVFLVTHHRPKSREAEAYRGLRTALYFSTQGEGHKVIQVTSPDPSDGKTMLVANLAVSIAQSGKRVLVLDGDFRRSKQHKVFGLEANEGLVTVLSGESEVADVVHETDIPGLFILPSGRHPPNPAELLTSPRFQELVDAVREQYDYVLVDTPPLLVVTDASVVAPRMDGVLLTIRITKYSRPAAQRATEMLTTLGAKVLGVVVNGIGGRPGYGPYYGGKYRGYGYGSYRYASRYYRYYRGYGSYYRGYGYGAYGYGYGYGDGYEPYGGGYYEEEAAKQQEHGERRS